MRTFRLLLMPLMLMAAVALSSCGDDEEDGYVGKPYDATLKILPEYGLATPPLLFNRLMPCIYGIDAKGDTLTFWVEEIKGFSFEEGYAYEIRIHATPNKWEAVMGDAPAYNYELLRVADKTYVGIDSGNMREETYRLTEKEDPQKSGFLCYEAVNLENGEETSFVEGEIINFTPNHDRRRLYEYVVKLNVYPKDKPTNHYNSHMALYRLQEVLQSHVIGE